MKMRLSALVLWGIFLAGFATAQAEVDFSGCHLIGEDQAINSFTLTARRMMADGETARDLFLRNPYDKTEEYDEGTAWSNAEEELYVSPGWIHYQIDDGVQTAQLFQENLNAVSLTNMEPQPADLAFSALEAIQKDAAEKLALLGIRAELVLTRAYKASDLQAEYDSILEEAEASESEEERENYLHGYTKSNWSQADECYFLYYRCREQGLAVSVSDTYSDIQKYGLEGSSIFLIYSEKGVIYFEAKGLYEIVETKPLEQLMIGFEDACEILKGYYRLYDVDVHYARRELVPTPIDGHDPDELFALTPTWVFTKGTEYNLNAPGVTRAGYDEGEMPDVSLSLQDFAMIDAVTGKEF